MAHLTHVNSSGTVRMVDVTKKTTTTRRARASGVVAMSRELVEQVRRQALPKGDLLAVAKIAGIQAAKRTAELIPLCHPLPLSHVEVQCAVRDDGVAITTTVQTASRTGVEMEALTAVSVAALALYDMCKGFDPSMVIRDIRLEEKTGGKQPFRREDSRCR